MKKIVLSVVIFVFSWSFTQKREIRNAVSAIESNNLSKAKEELAKAENIFRDQHFLLEPKIREDYYYAKGLTLIQEGKVSEGASYLAKIQDLGKNPIFKGKNEQKQKFYFSGKEEADKYGLGLNLKTEKYNIRKSEDIGIAVNALLQEENADALKAYENKSYAIAGTKFGVVNDLLKAVGSEDKTFKYYSGISNVQAKENKKAIKILTELIEEGYTGVKTEYKAKNIKTGQIENLDKHVFEILQKSGSKEYIDYKVSVTESVEQDLYETTAKLFLEEELFNELITLTQRGLAKFPTNNVLAELRGTAYYRMGKTDDFIKSLKEQLEKTPDDKVAWYNLGIIQSQNPDKIADAEEAFGTALKIDPDYIPALQAMFYNIYMGDDQKTIEKAEKAKKSKKIEEYNRILSDRRNRFKKGLPFLEKWYQFEPDNLELVKLLKGVYNTTRNEVKYEEFKAKETALIKKYKAGNISK